jgi:HSP20 family protein
MTRTLIPSLLNHTIFDELQDLASFCGRGACADVGVFEDEDSILVEAPVPGLKPDEIRVNLKEGVLYIQGERKEEKKEGKAHRRWVAKYSYSVALPQPVDETGEIKAESRDGVLSVRLPKSRASKPVRIVVK